MELYHYQVKGAKWGQRRYQNYDGSLTPLGRIHYGIGQGRGCGSSDATAFSKQMRSLKYDDTVHPLKSPDETLKSGSGNCHDQTLLELRELRKMGYKPQAHFCIEVNPKTGQGGVTHSFVTYRENGAVKWFENAWGGREGIHSFASMADVKKEIEKAHKNGEFGDNVAHKQMLWGTFDDSKVKPGDSLQDIVDKCLD